MTKSDDSPAFPITLTPGEARDDELDDGMTFRQYAAIHLKVPDSGDDWLDEMIWEARRLDFAGQALQRAMDTGVPCEVAYEIADAMMAKHKPRKKPCES